MKKISAVTILVMFSGLGMIHAQSTPGVDARQQQQRGRIAEGVVSGEVTRPEAAKLRAEQRRIHRTEKRVKADGKVTRRERAHLHRKQNQASRNIRREKRDAQDRPRAN